MVATFSEGVFMVLRGKKGYKQKKSNSQSSLIGNVLYITRFRTSTEKNRFAFIMGDSNTKLYDIKKMKVFCETTIQTPYAL